MRLLSPKAFLVLSIALALFATGCQQRYWYRIKLRTKPLQTVKVRIVNFSPDILDEFFEVEMLDACKKQLRKDGFQISTKDSANYEFELVMKVDTFNATIVGYRHVGVNNPMQTFSNAQVGVSRFEGIGSILLETRMWVMKTKSVRFEVYDDVYFFNEPKRDKRRSRGVARYMIRIGNYYAKY